MRDEEPVDRIVQAVVDVLVRVERDEIAIKRLVEDVPHDAHSSHRCAPRRVEAMEDTAVDQVILSTVDVVVAEEQDSRPVFRRKLEIERSAHRGGRQQ